MKYVATMTYANGSIIGATVEADGSEEAWRKLLEVISVHQLRSVQLAEVSQPTYEIN